VLEVHGALLYFIIQRERVLRKREREEDFFLLEHCRGNTQTPQHED
jgi:hypothetical protein